MRATLNFLHLLVLGIALYLVAWAALVFVNIPCIGLFALFSPRAALIVVGVVGIFTFLILVFLPAWGMSRILHGQVPRTLGLRNSYELARRSSGMSSYRRPKLVTYPDPVPNVFVVRSLAGHGTILLSEGLISLLDESEICFILSRAIRHLHSMEISVQSGCILILMFLQERMPFHSRNMTPVDALRHWMIFPWMRAFRKIAESSVTPRVAASNDAKEFVRGASKIARAEKLYGQQALLPGLVYLGLQR
jgi:Zn-dependent protease with chaperone function